MQLDFLNFCLNNTTIIILLYSRQMALRAIEGLRAIFDNENLLECQPTPHRTITGDAILSNIIWYRCIKIHTVSQNVALFTGIIPVIHEFLFYIVEKNSWNWISHNFLPPTHVPDFGTPRAIWLLGVCPLDSFWFCGCRTTTFMGI